MFYRRICLPVSQSVRSSTAWLSRHCRLWGPICRWLLSYPHRSQLWWASRKTHAGGGGRGPGVATSVVLVAAQTSYSTESRARSLRVFATFYQRHSSLLFNAEFVYGAVRARLLDEQALDSTRHRTLRWRRLKARKHNRLLTVVRCRLVVAQVDFCELLPTENALLAVGWRRWHPWQDWW